MAGISNQRPSARFLVVMTALILLLTGLAAARLRLPLWADEIVTVQQIGAPPQYGTISLSESLSRVQENVWHPPGYHVLLYFWGYAVGWTPFALRAMSLFAGLLAVALVAQLARRHFSARVAVYAAFTMGVSAFFINYLYDMRPYSLLVLTTLLMLWTYERAAIRVQPTFWAYAAFALSVAAVIYTHYFAALGVAALGTIHLAFRFRRPQSGRVIVAFAVGGLLFLPWAGVFVAGLDLSATNVRAVFNFTPSQMLYTLLTMFSSGAAALVVVLAVVGARERGRTARFVWLWLIACLALIVIASRVFPSLFAVRYLIFVFPALAVVSALGIEALRRVGVSPVVILTVWLAACLWNYTDSEAQDAILWRHFRPPFDALRAGVIGRTLPDDALLYALPSQAPNELTTGYLFDHYVYGLPLARATLLQDLEATTDAQYANDVRAGIAETRRVWLTYPAAERNWRVGTITEMNLPEAGYQHCGVVSAPDARIHVELWSRAGAPTDVHPFRVPNEGNITLDVMQPPILLDRDRLFFALGWAHAERVGHGRHSFALHVFDAAGALVAQLDRGLEPGGGGCYAGELALDSLPPGRYDVRLGVYNWQTGERLFGESDTWRSIATVDRHE
ncbi:MAG: glycosyltransferase family 39 protein [Chloroflexota bacterium]|nr:glycosyltransferase family 39 protein [Chloroflexota bacterium]